MIPEYKLYHGAVLADIIDRAKKPVAIEEMKDDGRLLNYVLNGEVGMQVRFATQRLRPWPFTFTQTHVDALAELKRKYGTAFLVLVCGVDGILVIEANEVIPSLLDVEGRQTWLKVDRKKRNKYRLTGPLGEFSHRYTTTTKPIVEALCG